MWLRVPALLLSLAACATGPLDQDQALTVVPYELAAGGRIIIELRVDGQGPFRFAIDTAATSSFLFGRALEQLGLAPVPELTATVHGAIASGSFPVVDLGRIDIGEVSWVDARLVALPTAGNASAGLDGVLGADFLRRYAVGFSIDDRALRLYRPDTIAARNYSGWSAIDLRPQYFGASKEALHFIDVSVEGRSVPALFDLGAGVSVLNSAAARILRLMPSSPGRRVEFLDAIGNDPIIAELASQSVETGRVRWRNESFLIEDLAIFATLGSADRPLAILGSGLFAQRDFVIDFARERLLVRMTSAEAE